jgi:hypothetical protein
MSSAGWLRGEAALKLSIDATCNVFYWIMTNNIVLWSGITNWKQIRKQCFMRYQKYSPMISSPSKRLIAELDSLFRDKLLHIWFLYECYFVSDIYPAASLTFPSIVGGSSINCGTSSTIKLGVLSAPIFSNSTSSPNASNSASSSASSTSSGIS